MTIFLVRHGQTRLSGRYCGSLNPPLTAHGRRQIERAAKQLQRFPIDVCYASPQRRAEQSAKILQRTLKTKRVKSDLLKELRFGAWEGLRFQDIEKKWPQLAKQWALDPTGVRIPRAESFTALRRRIKRFLVSKRSTFSGHNVLIVGHGAALAAIVLELLKRPTQEFPKYIQPLGSIRRVKNGEVQWVLRS